MKTLIFLTITLFMLAEIIPATASDSAVKTIMFKCSEISCNGCKKHITEAVISLDGIKSVDVNIEKKTVLVKYDDSKVSPDKIKETIEEAGYSAEVVD